MRLTQPLLNILTKIPLHGDLLPPARHLRHTTPRRKLFAQIFRSLFDIDPKGLESGNARHVFALVALDALDDDAAGGALFRLARLGSFGLLGFFVRVLFGALLGVEAEGAEVGCYGVCGGVGGNVLERDVSGMAGREGEGWG